MILITVGSQKFQFNRLLKEIDKLIENKIIKEEVFAQIGVSDYKPKNYKYVDFMSQDEFSNKMDEADIIITHAGTGVIVNAVKKEKKVIGVPRLAKYEEHVDDHQIQLINEFTSLGFIEPAYETKDINEALKNVKKKKYNKYISNTDAIIESIEKFINSDSDKAEKLNLSIITKNLVVNGISTVIMNYCRNMELNKYNITIYAGTPIVEQYKAECENLNIRIVELPSKRGGNPLKYYFYILKKINKKNCDVVHVHGNSGTIAIELLISKIKGIKNRIAHCHNTTCDNIKIHKILKPILKILYTKGFACSKEAGRWMFGNGKYEVLPNGFDTEKFQFDEKKRNEIRKKLKVEDCYVIGHVGMFNNQKNHPFMLKVFEKIAFQNEKAYLVFVGTGPDYEKIQKLINKHPYKERIICYGVTDKVSEIYDAMDLFFFPSKFEGLGIVLLEAQMKGLPCVASDAIPKEVELDKNMIDFLSLEADAEVWSKVILKKLENKINRKKVFEENKKKIKKFEIKENVKQLENNYKIVKKVVEK